MALFLSELSKISAGIVAVQSTESRLRLQAAAIEIETHRDHLNAAAWTWICIFLDDKFSADFDALAALSKHSSVDVWSRRVKSLNWFKTTFQNTEWLAIRLAGTCINTMSSLKSRFGLTDFILAVKEELCSIAAVQSMSESHASDLSAARVAVDKAVALTLRLGGRPISAAPQLLLADPDAAVDAAGAVQQRQLRSSATQPAASARLKRVCVRPAAVKPGVPPLLVGSIPDAAAAAPAAAAAAAAAAPAGAAPPAAAAAAAEPLLPTKRARSQCAPVTHALFPSRNNDFN
jgi:hypothetical protein